MAAPVSTPKFDPAALGFPGGTPSFPGSDALTSDAFKVVVASWRRINPATTSTSDFAVDVSTYAPRGPFVKRIQLVDVQVPSSQTLIEPPWNRLWFSMGLPCTQDFRRLDVELLLAGTVAAPLAVALVLPLPACQVLATEVLEPGLVRLLFAQAAPSPAQAVAAAWAAQGGRFSLVGIPVIPGGVLDLTQDLVRSVGIPNAMDVRSYALADAVQSLGFDPGCLWLLASRLPSDDALARVVSWGVSLGLQSVGASPSLKFMVAYCSGPQEDRFKLQFRGPVGTHVRVLPGSVATYMGLDGVPIPAGAPPVRAPASRVQPPLAYARLPSANYPTPAALAGAVSTAASAYTWPAFDLGIVLPSASAVPPTLTAHVAGGHCLLPTLAKAVQVALDEVLPPAARVVVGWVDHAGLTFSSTVSFQVKFPASPSLGYTPGYLTPWGLSHFPNDVQGPHVPLWCGDVPCAADVQAVVDTRGSLVVTSAPFAPFAVQVEPSGCLGAWTGAPVLTSFAPGLLPGALVQLCTSDFTVRTTCVVTRAEPEAVGAAATMDLAQLDPGQVPVLPWASGPLLLVPLDAPPLVLYMQTASASVGRVDPVPCALLGFQPDTYASAGASSLVSPGSVRVRGDPYLLLCLSFYASDATVLTGDVYYPLETPSGGSQLVFAQVLRCGAEFRSDYERVFNHSFPGAGMHLGYIRVKILNADGSPYQAHGHPVSICLRMDVMTDHIALGGPSHMASLPLEPFPSSSNGATLF